MDRVNNVRLFDQDRGYGLHYATLCNLGSFFLKSTQLKSFSFHVQQLPEDPPANFCDLWLGDTTCDLALLCARGVALSADPSLLTAPNSKWLFDELNNRLCKRSYKKKIIIISEDGKAGEVFRASERLPDRWFGVRFGAGCRFDSRGICRFRHELGDAAARAGDPQRALHGFLTAQGSGTAQDKLLRLRHGEQTALSDLQLRTVQLR